MAKLADSVTRIRQSQRGDPDGRMTLMEHIRELRNRLVKVTLAIIVGMAIGLVFFTPIWHLIEHPFCAAMISEHSRCGVLGHTLIINGVFDAFMLHLKVAFFFGLIATSPIWFYQLWAFIAPGLYRREKRWTYAFVFIAAPLFAAGAGIAFFAMSRGLKYLLAPSLCRGGVTRGRPTLSGVPRPETGGSSRVRFSLFFRASLAVPVRPRRRPETGRCADDGGRRRP